MAPQLPAERSDPALETLREILLDDERRQLDEVISSLTLLEQRLGDEEALVRLLAPVLGASIRRQIRESRDEMIEALYPIIGQVVMRAVREALRDLARRVDARVQSALTPGALWRRLGGRLRGLSDAEIALRDALPFAISELFLIHRESGLLLWYFPEGGAEEGDRDLVSGMLTAIREFVGESFGNGREGQLDEIEYGDAQIIIEAGHHSYLAVVVSGIPPTEYRAGMRAALGRIEQRLGQTLRDYDGQSGILPPMQPMLQDVLDPTLPAPPGAPPGAGQAVFFLALLVFLLVFILALGVPGLWP